ncbi:MAG: oligosaccharide flippase family protein [candidate division Zixibacteria bacterium]|nr:oligosaccharide flippase family protein [candidate division Zixibacteria bacterium]MBU1469389.1 oligosaccharide flippase family protein [candidate division Zixibacteria bacterium]MBU2626060.1 oligosaccharide flippase family protein [candidate division Zixibacteria bacterium]
MNFFASTVTTLASKVLTILFGTLTGVLTARALGPSGRGTLSVILSTVLIGVIFGEFGLIEANAYMAAGDRRKSAKLTVNSLWSSMGFGTLTGCVIVALYLISPDIFEAIPLSLMIVGLISVPFVMLGLMLQRIYLGQNRIVQFNAYDLISKLLVLILTFVGLYLLHVTLSTYLMIYAAIFCFSGVIFFLGQRVSLSTIMRPDLGVLKESLRYGFRAYIAVSLPFVLSRLGLYFVNAQLGATEAGQYSVAMQANDLFLIVPGVIGTLLFSRVAADQKTHTLTLKSFRFMLMVMLPIFILGQIFTRELVLLLFGADFLPAVLLMRILFIGGFATGLGVIFLNDLAGRGYPLFIVLMWLPLCAINVILNLVLMNLWGTAGAAASLAVTYVLGFIAAVLYFRYYVKVRGWSGFLPRPGDFTDLIQSCKTAVAGLTGRGETRQ